jgi:phosphoglucosamine mutase
LGKVIRIEDARGRYIEFAKAAIGNQSLEGLKIVLDCANGAAYQIGPWIFKELGAEVVRIGVDPNGFNINEGCGALYPDNIGKLVCENAADAGIAFDGDADRVIFCDGEGKVVDGDRILAMYALDLKDRGLLSKDSLVVTIMSNLGLHEALKRRGIEVVTTPVGDRYVIEKMRAEGYNLGGEKSGHIIFMDHSSTGDGIISALQVLKLMKQQGKALKELADCMEEYPQKMVSLPVSKKPPLADLPRVSEALKESEEALKNEGRVVLRYSGTEPKVRILVEAREQSLVDEWLATLSDAINAELRV